MFKLSEKPKTMQVTKALAKEFADMTRAPHDRPMSERRLLVYERILRAGEFRPVTWASAYCKAAGDTYRVNGKHTSTMLSGLKELPPFFVTVERYECDGLEDVAKLYSTFDSSLASRTTRDINNSFAGVMSELAGVNRRAVHLAVTAASFLHWGPNYATVPAPDRAELLLDNGPFCVWLAGKLFPADGDKGRAWFMIRSAVVSAMLGCYRKDKAAADEFWTAVRDEGKHKADAPSRVLARFLSHSYANSSTAGRKRKTVGFREMYVKSVYAWNAHRLGERPTKLRYHVKTKLPEYS